MILITASATDQITSLLSEESALYVRLFIEGGGCSGFNYGFTFETEKNEDDFNFGNLVVDAMSMQYLEGAEIDFKKSIGGSQFVVNNPNAVSTCGCGSSFTV